jgi:spectinomycin phosphotransferase
MITEPAIDRKIIQSAIEVNYQIAVTDLTFIEGGEASWGYHVQAQHDKHYFFKIHNGITNYQERFKLTYRLYTDSGITNITHPITNKHEAFVIFLNEYPSALFNFINGHTAAEETLDESERFALGSLLGRIHTVKTDFSLNEDFIYQNMHRLVNSVEIARSFLKDSSSYKTQAAELLLEDKKIINNCIQKLHEAGQTLQKRDIDFVICHGEPHKWNTMVDKHGEVFLIDWDDALFAPREKDLRMVLHDPIAIKGYEKIVGGYKLNNDVLHYYDLEWYISSIDAWVIQIFSGKSNDLQNRHFLDELRNDIAALNEL